MQIIIRLNSIHKIPEYSLIELQGELNTKSEEPLDGKLIGDVHFGHDGHPVMIIGHHILHGKFQELEKPFLVISKETNQEMEGGVKQDVKYGVSAVIQRKLVFKTRPKPIVGEMIKKLL